jgi:prolipoprotein diacylglyceryl transferase
MMFVLSFLFGMIIYKKMILREKKPLTLWDNILWPVFIGAFLGARLGHCLFYQPEYFIPHFWEIFIPLKNGKLSGFEGLASHGGAVGILLGLYYYSRKNKVAYLWTLDHIVISVALAGFFIRTGNLMNSEVYGHATDLPWGFVFAQNHEVVPKHPTQIYEALCYMAIFVFLYMLYLKKRPPFRDGVIFSLFLILLFGARFIVEFWKEVQVEFEKNMTLDMGQWLSIPLIIAGIVLFISLYKKGLTVVPSPEPTTPKVVAEHNTNNNPVNRVNRGNPVNPVNPVNRDTRNPQKRRNPRNKRK